MSHTEAMWREDWDSPEDSAAYDWITDESLTREDKMRIFDGLCAKGQRVEVNARIQRGLDDVAAGRVSRRDDLLEEEDVD